MILIDPPIDWGHALNRKFGPNSHMVSDIHGAEGTAELVAFARKIGMRASWLQKAGTEHEHFDVFASRRLRAIDAGAREVTKREIVEVWQAKRAALKEAAVAAGGAGSAGGPAAAPERRGQVEMFGGER